MKLLGSKLNTVTMSCFAILAYSYATFSYAAPEIAGIVLASSGDVKAVNADKKIHNLARRSNFFVGDTITTGHNAQVQLRYSDGTLLQLKPDSTYRVDAFHYSLDNPKLDKYAANLIQGGFETLTGALTKRSPAAYQVKTPVATIGVRGTKYSAQLASDYLYVWVDAGKVFVANLAGTQAQLVQANQAVKINNTAIQSVNPSNISGWHRSKASNFYADISNSNSTGANNSQNTYIPNNNVIYSDQLQGTSVEPTPAPTPCNPQQQQC